MKNNFKIKIFFIITLLVFSGFTSTVSAEESATFFIRNGESLLWSGPISIPGEGTVEITDNSGSLHTVDARSVLAVLYSADEENDAFALSNLQFFDSFGAFYVKCISDSGGVELCDNWQYAVGSTTPSQSIDTVVLSGGETVGVYFGTSHRLRIPNSGVITGEPFNVASELYDYNNNTWTPLSGVSVGVTLPNPDDPWSPTVVSTHPVDQAGSVDIVLTELNTYSLGIVEDFYFPSYEITVSPVPPDPVGSGVSGGSIGGNNDMTIQEAPSVFDVSRAIDYLKSVQGEYNPSSGSDIYTDWATIAYSAAGVLNDPSSPIFSNLESYSTPGTLLTDNERRTMVLLSLGQNPYSFMDVNYIKIITDAFDGIQFGDSSLVNDDIFALIPLVSAGYTEGDDIIVKDISFILSKQKDNGSWEDSVDLTAAAIVALYPFVSATNVYIAISDAGTYLQDTQKEDGGWGSVHSTSWAMQAMSILNESWIKNDKKPIDYLGSQQASDGAMLSPEETLKNKIWATSYVIPAVLNKSWSMIFQKVEKIIEDETTDEPVLTTGVGQDIKKDTTETTSKVNKKVVSTQPAPDTLVASVVESDVSVPNKSLLEMIISTGLAILLKFIF